MESTSIIQRYRDAMKAEPNGEPAQALLRWVIIIIGSIYGLVLHIADRSQSSGMGLLCIAVGTNLISAMICWGVIYKPGNYPWRRIVAALHDNIACTALLYDAGLSASLYLFTYPFVTVGYGFRFGVKYLAISGVLGALGISYIMFFSPAWSSQFMIAAGILFSNIVVTIYTGVLLRKLNQAKTELEALARVDALTGLPNRRSFMEFLGHSLQSTRRYRSNLVCMYFDLDGFKKVNDVCGHEIGDKLLQKVSMEVKKCFRGTDIFARLGGDEFIVLLREVRSLDDAVRIGQRVIESIQAIKNIEGHQVVVSASVGLNYVMGENIVIENQEELMNAVMKDADEAMYRAKRAGKGRVEIANPQPQQQAA